MNWLAALTSLFTGKAPLSTTTAAAPAAAPPGAHAHSHATIEEDSGFNPLDESTFAISTFLESRSMDC